MKITPDKINCYFELAAAIVTWINVYILYRDKKVLGMCWQSIVIFSLIGYWHILYYIQLQQFYSVIMGSLLVAGNVTWLCLSFYFKFFIKKQ